MPTLTDPDTERGRNPIQERYESPSSQGNIDRGIRDPESQANDTSLLAGAGSSTDKTVDDLEDLYKRPSRNDSERNADRSLYKGGGNDSTVPGGLVGKIKARRKKIFGGGIAGLVLGGGLFGFSILSGPLQFLHLANILSAFHLDPIENVFDDRAGKITRYAKNPGRDGRRYRRMGTMGNFFANGVETKLKVNGIETVYNSSGYYDGYRIDPDLFDEGRFAGDPEGAKKIRSTLEAEGITASVEDGKVRVANQKGYIKNRGTTNRIAKIGGYGAVTGKVASRLLRTRGAVTFHPIRKADKAVTQSIDAFNDRRRSRINDGVDEGRLDAAVNEKERSTNPDEPDRVISSTDINQSQLERIRTSTSFKTAGVSTAAIGVLCAVQGISQAYDSIAHQNINLPMMRLGMEYVSIGSQVMSGEDFDLEQLSHYSKAFYDEESESSWVSAKSIQYELGEATTGEDIPDHMRPSTEANPVAQFVAGIPLIGPACEAANSIVGRVVTFGLDVFSGPVSAAVSVALEATGAMQAAVDFVLNLITKDPVDVANIAGSAFGNAANFGVRMAANDQFIASGGSELSPANEARLDEVNNTFVKAEYSQKSFLSRLTNIRDVNSLTGQVVFKAPSSSTELISALSPSTLFANLFTAPLKPAFSEVYAAGSSYDYGFSEYGFSLDELEDERFEDPFANEQWFDDNPAVGGDSRFVALSDEYGEDCFGVSVDENGKVRHLEAVNTNSIPNKCRDNSEELVRFRFYLLDSTVATAGACFEGLDEACEDLGY